LDDAAEADDTIKLVLPKNNPAKMVKTTAVVNIPKRVFIAVNEFITSIKSVPVKVYLCRNVPPVVLTSCDRIFSTFPGIQAIAIKSN
jgi:hypothetical protein